MLIDIQLLTFGFYNTLVHIPNQSQILTIWCKGEMCSKAFFSLTFMSKNKIPKNNCLDYV